MATMGDFWLMDRLFPGSPGDSLLFKEDDLHRLKRKGFHVSTYIEEKPQPTVPKEDKHKSPHTKENAPSSSQKEESHKTSGRNSGTLSPQASDSTNSKKSSHWGKHSPLAKEQPDSHDTEDHHISSSRHKDRSHSDKSSRHGSDKESSSTPCKHALSPRPCAGSAEHPWKGSQVDEPSCIPSESSCANHRSPSRSMSELKDHSSFTAPTSSSTLNKLRTQLHYQSSFTSRLSMMPLDTDLHNSFSFYGPPGCGKGGATPVTSVAGLHHVSSSIWQPPRLTSPQAMQTLSAEQSTEIFNLAAEYQALSTELAKQFQTLSRLEVMHCTVAQATAHETINVRWMTQNTAYSILPDGQTQDKKA